MYVYEYTHMNCLLVGKEQRNAKKKPQTFQWYLKFSLKVCQTDIKLWLKVLNKTLKGKSATKLLQLLR